MTATLEWLCACRHAAVVRIHGDGDAYCCCTVVAEPGGAAKVIAVMRAPTRPEARALLGCLRAEGFGAVRWERRQGGRVRQRWHGL